VIVKTVINSDGCVGVMEMCASQ